MCVLPWWPSPRQPGKIDSRERPSISGSFAPIILVSVSLAVTILIGWGMVTQGLVFWFFRIRALGQGDLFLSLVKMMQGILNFEFILELARGNKSWLQLFMLEDDLDEILIKSCSTYQQKNKQTTLRILVVYHYRLNHVNSLTEPIIVN